MRDQAGKAVWGLPGDSLASMMSNLHLTQSVREALKVLEKNTRTIFLKVSSIWLEAADWIRERRGSGREKVQKG